MTAPIRAIVFDRPAFDAWLARQPEDRAAEIRAGLELVDYFNTEYAAMMDRRKERNDERKNGNHA